eukprot:284808_1
MNPQTKAAFDTLLSQSSNKTCIDCNAFNPQWASVNNGCFMCIKCAGNHRSMGVHITFVRSVTMDGWSKTQLQRVKRGGNGKLKQFWSKQKFPKQLTAKQRLDNKAMDKYRERLLALAKGEAAKEIPFIGYIEREYANKSLSNLSAASHSSSSLSSVHSANKSNSNFKMQGFGNTDYTPNSDNTKANPMEDTWNDLSGWASSFAAKTSAAASDLAQKSKEKATTIKNKINDDEYQANLKKNATETWQKTSNTLSSWWSTASTSVTNAINDNFAMNETQGNDAPVLYHKDNDKHKKMPALSSDQYFDATKNKQKQEDILGINEMHKAQDIDKIAPPFPIKTNGAVKEDKVKEISDDFDDWGFDDKSDKKKQTVAVESLLD